MLVQPVVDNPGVRPGDPNSLDSSDRRSRSPGSQKYKHLLFLEPRDLTSVMCKTPQLRFSIMSGFDLAGI